MDKERLYATRVPQRPKQVVSDVWSHLVPILAIGATPA